ncbi:hypothetical protein ACXYTP_23610 [Tsukamurella ocularis]
MTAPKLDVQPGWRGTDSDGRTWVLADNRDVTAPWFVGYAGGGGWAWVSQEEAEAAGLVAVVAETELAESQDAVRYWRGLWEAEKDRAPAPAPLDPGNPEDCDAVAAFVERANDLDRTVDPGSANGLRHRAKRIRAERAEAAQDAADHTRAEAIANEAFTTWMYTSGSTRFVKPFGEQNDDYREAWIAAALAGIRAGRTDAVAAEDEDGGQ